MPHVETLNEGLKRAYTLTIPAADIEARVDTELKAIAPSVRMPGFRPGKVPANLVRKMHGPQLMQQALERSVRDGVDALVAGEKLRPAMAPTIELEEGYEVGSDAAVKVALEVLPAFDVPALDDLKLERLQVPVDDAAVDAQLERIASQSKRFEDAPEGHSAATGDQVVMDFAGSVDGVAFDGGTGSGMAVELGSGQLIPGFEEQLAGAKVGDEREVKVTFPADYPAENLAGKDAVFAVTVTAVKQAAETKLDDDFAKQLGLQGIDQLRKIMTEQVEQEHNGLTRTHMKRRLLDQLADAHDFEVPPSMVEAEFAQIWRQLESEIANEADPEAAKAELENDRDEYRKIAERRVRLGLLLSEIGQANGVTIDSNEMNRLIAQAAQQYRPEDRQRFVEYIQNDPLAAAQLRAPLFEEKVVDFLFGKATVTDREVTRAELEAAIEADEDGAPAAHVHGPDCDHDHDHDHGQARPAAKKGKGKGKAASSDETASKSGDAAEDANAAAAVTEAPTKADKPKAARKPKAAKAGDDAGAAEAPASADTAAPKPKSRAKKPAAE